MLPHTLRHLHVLFHLLPDGVPNVVCDWSVTNEPEHRRTEQEIFVRHFFSGEEVSSFWMLVRKRSGKGIPDFGSRKACPTPGAASVVAQSTPSCNRFCLMGMLRTRFENIKQRRSGNSEQSAYRLVRARTAGVDWLLLVGCGVVWLLRYCSAPIQPWYQV